MKSISLWNPRLVDKLVSKVFETKNKEELVSLMDRILTTREINDAARRLETIEMLDSGSSYAEIREKVGLSDPAIAKLSAKIGFGFRRGVTQVEKTKSKRKKVTILPRYKGVPAFKI